VRRNDSVSFGLLGESIGAGANGVDARRASAVDMVVEGQIRGLEGAYDYLRAVRERQKAKLMEMVYGSGSRRGNPGISGVLDGIATGGGGAAVVGSGGVLTDGIDGR